MVDAVKKDRAGITADNFKSLYPVIEHIYNVISGGIMDDYEDIKEDYLDCLRLLSIALAYVGPDEFTKVYQMFKNNELQMLEGFLEELAADFAYECFKQHSPEMQAELRKSYQFVIQLLFDETFDAIPK